MGAAASRRSSAPTPRPGRRAGAMQTETVTTPGAKWGHMLSRPIEPAAVLAGAAVVAVAAALAVPVLELRTSADAVREVALVHAPALWGDVLVSGTGTATLIGLLVAVAGVMMTGHPLSRYALVGAAGAVQLDVALLRIAAWDVTGSGLGVAGTRFGLVVLGGSVGLLLLAAAMARPAPEGRGLASVGARRSWWRRLLDRRRSAFEPERDGWPARAKRTWRLRRSPWL